MRQRPLAVRRALGQRHSRRPGETPGRHRRRLTGGEERGKVLIIVNNAGERRRSARSEQKPMAARISSREFATMINGDDNC
jgi:hypothetical protein